VPDRARSSTTGAAIVGAAARLALLALVAVTPAAGKTAADRLDPKTWIEGPVRYIATEDEARVYRALSTDAERSAFIESFWRRRDPVAGTDENEYRRLFHSRVREASQNFTETAAPGWKTDRGRLHILCGPPNRIEDEPYADVTASASTAGRGLLRWVYEGKPCGRSDVGPVVIVAFVRTVDGAYRLSYDPKLSALAFNLNNLTDPSRLALDRWLDVVSPPERSALSVMLDMGKLQEAPHPEEVLLDRVETIETYGSRPLPVELNRFQYPQGGMLLVITVRLPAGASSGQPSLMARLAPRDTTRSRRFLTEESFRIEEAEGDRVAQARLVLDRGTWDLTVLSAEPGTSSSGLFKGVAEVPAPREGLRLSDVVIARRLEPLPFASMFSYDEPYHLGGFRVVPRVGKPLRRQEPVTLFHEVYGGSGPFKVSYQLEGREDDGRWTALGKPFLQEQEAPAQGWSIPVGAHWPPGEYRVQILVEDAKGLSDRATVPFVVEP